MKVGITLPQFRHEAAPALEVARRADEAGLDGVFGFDHLWPLGQPGRPALHSTTLLAAVAAATARIAVGTLVARVGTVPDEILIRAIVSLHDVAGGRFVAGLGTGDRANRRENLAYGIAYPPAAERLESVRRCSRSLRAAGVRTWIGGLSRPVREAAAECADGWNGWGLDPAGFARLGEPARRAGIEATWAGQVLIGRTAAEARSKLERLGGRPGLVHGTVAEVAGHLAALSDAGAAWAVCAPLDVGRDPEAVALVAEAARLAAG